MTAPSVPSASVRTPLSRQRVLETAMALADRDGIDALTMRSLADALDVRPMSLYHHVANKDAILDGIVDAVFAEIDLPRPGADWMSAMRDRAESARHVLARHPWALTLLNSRVNPGPATLRHHDAVIGTLRAGGFSVAMAAHAFSLIDSYVYGFALQETTLPFDGPDTAGPMAEEMLAHFPTDEFPHLAEFTVQHVLQPGYDHGLEFGFGLQLILDGLAAHPT
jgi:AcrR family transcriptional regulator